MGATGERDIIIQTNQLKEPITVSYHVVHSPTFLKIPIMDINQIYNTVLEAAKNWGVAGATTAVLTGGASAAGKAAFETLKDWFSKTFGSQSDITKQLTVLEANPNDAIAQAQFRASLEQHAMQFQNVELVKIIQSMQQNSGTTYNQYAETIKNVSISGGVNTLNF